jgi:transcriptional enhancer factor
MRIFSDRYSSPSTSDAQYGYICISTTIDELSYTPSQEEKTRDAEQVVATGRKSWKTLKGKGESVWPPIL